LVSVRAAVVPVRERATLGSSAMASSRTFLPAAGGPLMTIRTVLGYPDRF